jgi:hypothetical protein
MKKVLVVLVLLMVIGGGVFAQSGPKNWISGTVGILGGGAQYERVLTEKFSIGAAVYYNTLFFFWHNFGVEAVGRFYPLANGGLFIGLGAGFGYKTGLSDFDDDIYGGTTSEWARWTGFLLEPSVGWKFDLGASGGFFIEPLLAVPIIFGAKKGTFSGWSDDSEFGVGVSVRPAFSLGYAF